MTKVPRVRSKAGKAKSAAFKYGYRSGLEKDVASSLRRRKVPVKYETEKIKWEDFMVRTYTPDFLLPNGIIIETKGRFTVADRRKHKEIQKQYPSLDIRFVFTNANAKLSKVSKTTYAQWCKRYNFKYATGDIPDEWLEEKIKDDI